MLELISFFWVNEHYELEPQICIKQNHQWHILNQIFIDKLQKYRKITQDYKLLDQTIDLKFKLSHNIQIDSSFHPCLPPDKKYWIESGIH